MQFHRTTLILIFLASLTLTALTACGPQATAAVSEAYVTTLAEEKMQALNDGDYATFTADFSDVLIGAAGLHARRHHGPPHVQRPGRGAGAPLPRPGLGRARARPVAAHGRRLLAGALRRGHAGHPGCAGVDRAVLCGQSLGGYIAQHIYRLAPARVQAMILIGTTPIAKAYSRWEVWALKASLPLFRLWPYGHFTQTIARSTAGGQRCRRTCSRPRARFPGTTS
jgi:hypothetical protein